MRTVQNINKAYRNASLRKIAMLALLTKTAKDTKKKNGDEEDIDDELPRSSAIGDWARGVPAHIAENAAVDGLTAAYLPHLAPLVVLPQAAGSVLGLYNEAPTVEELRRKSKLVGLLPGVYNYRELQRRKAMSKATGGKQNIYSELFGSGLTAPLLLGALGAGVGGLSGATLTKGDKVEDGLSGAALGGIGGATLGYGAATIGGLMAALRKRRTLKEQADYDAISHPENWYLPGVGLYNYYKGVGASNHLTNPK